MSNGQQLETTKRWKLPLDVMTKVVACVLDFDDYPIALQFSGRATSGGAYIGRAYTPRLIYRMSYDESKGIYTSSSAIANLSATHPILRDEVKKALGDQHLVELEVIGTYALELAEEGDEWLSPTPLFPVVWSEHHSHDWNLFQEPPHTRYRVRTCIGLYHNNSGPSQREIANRAARFIMTPRQFRNWANWVRLRLMTDDTETYCMQVSAHTFAPPYRADYDANRALAKAEKIAARFLQPLTGLGPLTRVQFSGKELSKQGYSEDKYCSTRKALRSTRLHLFHLTYVLRGVVDFAWVKILSMQFRDICELRDSVYFTMEDDGFYDSETRLEANKTMKISCLAALELWAVLAQHPDCFIKHLTRDASRCDIENCFCSSLVITDSTHEDAWGANQLPRRRPSNFNASIDVYYHLCYAITMTHCMGFRVTGLVTDMPRGQYASPQERENDHGQQIEVLWSIEKSLSRLAGACRDETPELSAAIHDDCVTLRKYQDLVRAKHRREGPDWQDPIEWSTIWKDTYAYKGFKGAIRPMSRDVPMRDGVLRGYDMEAMRPWRF